MEDSKTLDKFQREAKQALTENEIPSNSRIYKVSGLFLGQRKINVWEDVGPVEPNDRQFYVGQATLISKEGGPQFQIEFIIRAESTEEAFEKWPAYLEVAAERVMQQDRIKIVKPTAKDMQDAIRGKIK